MYDTESSGNEEVSTAESVDNLGNEDTICGAASLKVTGDADREHVGDIMLHLLL